MELTVIPHIDVPELHLYCLSDLHFGSAECNEDLLQHDIEVIRRDPHARCILNGDLLQMDFKNSKGNVYHQKYPPSKQKQLFKQILRPISDKVLAMQGGNHDEGRSEEDSTNIYDIAEALGIKYTDTEMCLKVSVGCKANKKPAVYTVYATHGWSNGRMIGAKANNLHRLSDIVLADIYFISHTHTKIAFPDLYYVPDLHNNNVREIIRYYVNSGSYQGRGKYPTSKGMRPTALGTPLVILSGTEKHIEVRV